MKAAKYTLTKFSFTGLGLISNMPAFSQTNKISEVVLIKGM